MCLTDTSKITIIASVHIYTRKSSLETQLHRRCTSIWIFTREDRCIGHTRNWCAICRGKTAPKDFFFRRGKTATVFHRSGEQIQSHKVRGFSEEYQSIVNKVRRVVKVFKRSPTKNDNALQPYVKREFSKEVSVILDWRTR